MSTATPVAGTGPTVRASTASPEARAKRRARTIGLVFLAAGLTAFWFYGLNAEGGVTSEFRMNVRGTSFQVPDLSVPTRSTGIMLGALCVGLGVFQLIRGFGRATVAVGTVVGVAFVLAFLAYSARGDSIGFVGMLQQTMVRATPLTLGAIAGILCERSGIINIAIEGMMLTAAFAGAVVGSVASNLYIGLGAAILAGALAGLALAVLSIRYRVDQIIGGTAVNILAAGLTAFVAKQLGSIDRELVRAGTFHKLSPPLLADIPVIGPILFNQSIFVYAMYASVAWFTFALFRTRWGLRLRAAGEHPKAADTVGINVPRTRYLAVMLGGAMAGLAGAYFTLGSTGSFEENMTSGRGFIALAAVLFGRYRPVGAMIAALLFGFAESLQPALAILGSPVPSQFLQMAPYLVTVIAVAGFVGAARPPAAEGKPYP